MARAKISVFGGILPGVSERALPPENATQAENLLAQVQEFRPILDAVAYSGLSPSNPRTLYRFRYTSSGALNDNFSTGWKAYSAVTYLVPWPQNDNATERTSLANGTAAPRVIDNTGTDRQLGVPPPPKPTLTLNVGDYYTEEERASDITALKNGILVALQGSMDPAKVGAVYTNDAIPGYLESGPEVDPAPALVRYRVHRYSGFEGTITDSYTGAGTSNVAWVRATRLGEWMQAAATPAWMGGAGQWHYALPYQAYGLGLRFDEAAAEAALDALPFLEQDQIDDLVAMTALLFDPDSTGAASVIQPLRAAVSALEVKLDERPQGTVDSVAQAAQIATMTEAVANQIYELISRYAGNTGVSGAGAE